MSHLRFKKQRRWKLRPCELKGLTERMSVAPYLRLEEKGCKSARLPKRMKPRGQCAQKSPVLGPGVQRR